MNLIALILSFVLPFFGGLWIFLRSGHSVLSALIRGLWMTLYAVIPVTAFAILAAGTKQLTGFNVFPLVPVVVLLFFMWISRLRSPTLQQGQVAEVVTYKPNAYCQIKLPTGERVLINCAQTGIKISRLALGGLIPTETIVEWPISRIDFAIAIFADESAPAQHPLDAIKNKLLNCQSIGDIERLCVSRDSARPAQAPSSPIHPMPYPARPFDSALRDLGNRLRAESGLGPCENLADVVTIVLTEITTSTLTHTGSDHLPHPKASTVANASMGACFMGACLSGISVRLKELGLELDVQDIFARAGFAVFQMYPQQEQAQIISAGGNIFKKLVGESSSRENLRQWIEGVQTLTASYVLTGDKACIPQLAELYSTLASARE